MEHADIGETVRFLFVFLDEDDALETPTAVDIEREDADGTTTTVSSPDSSITLGKVAPERIRDLLARDIVGITSSDLAAGTGVVEYTFATTTSGVLSVKCTSTAPSATVATAKIRVRPDHS